MGDHKLLARLSELKRRARLLSAARGMSTTIALALAVFLIAVLLDWLVHLPPAFRSAISLLLVVSAAVMLRCRVWSRGKGFP
jgi:hypothetical protein